MLDLNVGGYSDVDVAYAKKQSMEQGKGLQRQGSDDMFDQMMGEQEDSEEDDERNRFLEEDEDE
jgi:hypothetical protein